MLIVRNFSGITVLDITDLNKVRYAFVVAIGLSDDQDFGTEDRSDEVLQLDVMKGILPKDLSIVRSILLGFKKRPLSAGEHLLRAYFSYKFPKRGISKLFSSTESSEMTKENILGTSFRNL